MIYPTQMYVYNLDKVTCLKGLRNGSGRKPGAHNQVDFSTVTRGLLPQTQVA